MRNWRIISTVAAVVFAAIAGVLVWKYVTNADTRARAEEGPGHGPRRQDADRPRARCSTGPRATSCSRPKQIPRDSLPPDQIAPDTDAKLLTLYKGKVAVDRHLHGNAARLRPVRRRRRSSSAPSPARSRRAQQAITVSLDQTHSVGGFVTPGDKVNVHPATIPIIERHRNATAAQGDGLPAPGPQGDRGRLVDGPAASGPAAQNAAGQRRHDHHDAPDTARRA